MLVSPGVYAYEDTCNVYVVPTGSDAVLIDFGSGDVLDHLADFGVERVTDVLVTHHHRDQVQGLARAVDQGIRVWVPPVERDLFDGVDAWWRHRELDNDYRVLQDRFSLLTSVAVTGTVEEYRSRRYGALEVHTLPTPGHTVGSVSYLVDIEGTRIAFTGDLIYGTGKVWSLAATQWAYTGLGETVGLEGVAATGLSALQLLDHEPALLLPSHGEPIRDPVTAVTVLRDRLEALLATRRSTPWNLESHLHDAWEPVTEHLLRNRAGTAYSYALLSESGDALLFDFGYDLITGLPETGHGRWSRRPQLATLPVLRDRYGVDRIEAVLPTHYHDDHVAGFNLLREVWGTRVWSPSNVTPILERPTDHDLPCLWYDPIPVDRDIPVGGVVRWREYEIEVHELPGHTLFAVAYSLTVDGRRVIVTGDQQNGAWQPDGRPELLNYQYRNRFRIDDFTRSAELYLRLRPDLMVSGHWAPREVTQDYLEMLLASGEQLARLHRELLPLEEVDFGADGCAARITPYRSRVSGGVPATLRVWLRNPFPASDQASISLVGPAGWTVEPPRANVVVPPRGETTIEFTLVAPPGVRVDRARIAADLTVGKVRFGQQAECLVSVG